MDVQAKYPDIKRMYLIDQAERAEDDDRYALLVGLLANYDRGLIDMAIDPWDCCIKFRTLEIQ